MRVRPTLRPLAAPLGCCARRGARCRAGAGAGLVTSTEDSCISRGLDETVAATVLIELLARRFAEVRRSRAAEDALAPRLTSTVQFKIAADPFRDIRARVEHL